MWLHKISKEQVYGFTLKSVKPGHVSAGAVLSETIILSYYLRLIIVFWFQLIYSTQIRIFFRLHV